MEIAVTFNKMLVMSALY